MDSNSKSSSSVPSQPTGISPSSPDSAQDHLLPVVSSSAAENLIQTSPTAIPSQAPLPTHSLGSSSTSTALPKSYRSSFACVRCHSAKIRCDANIRGIPCTRCRQRMLTDCRPQTPRRGPAAHLATTSHEREREQDREREQEKKLDRERRGDLSLGTAKRVSPAASSSEDYSRSSTDMHGIVIDSVVSQPSYQHSILNPQPTQFGLPDPNVALEPNYTFQTRYPRLSSYTNYSKASPTEVSESSDGVTPATVSAYLASPQSTQTRASPPSPTPPSVLAPSMVALGGGVSAHRENVQRWALYFEYYFTSNRQRISSDINKGTSEYFGAQSPLSFLTPVIHPCRHIDIRLPNFAPSDSDAAQAQSSCISSNPGSGPCSGLAHPTYMSSAKLGLLSAVGCFELPQPEILEALISAFYDRVLPIYPIIRRGEFAQSLSERKVPWIFMHAICFTAARHVEIKVLSQSGVATHLEARRMFYKRAKALFDLGYERDKTVIIQVAVLLSCWSGRSEVESIKPDLSGRRRSVAHRRHRKTSYVYSNAYAWINIAASAAESAGMHQDCNSEKDEQRRWWRRIWWSICARDSFYSALLGRPLRINLEQCNVSPLNVHDFLFDREGDSDESVDIASNDVGLRKEQVLYSVQLNKLGLILRQILTARVKKRYGAEFVLDMHGKLRSFLDDLPSEFDIVHNKNCVAGTIAYPYAAAIQLIYNHHLIYIHQMSLPESGISELAASHAAMEIVELASSLVTSSIIRAVPQDAYSSFFMAIVMLFTQLHKNGQQNDDLKLAQSQLKMCEMIVVQIREVWEHADWILELCEDLKRKLNAPSISLVRITDDSPANPTMSREDSEWTYQDFANIFSH
ncbi:fungal-specific transcription factor domain-containing protein [Lipomyces oligophaga]|uniref:fungal-specific transcription factor domain-containing protein n=1 Tax=Lipomyces oligophaga TaxID=45792 RepID=UPI0034CE10C8